MFHHSFRSQKKYSRTSTLLWSTRKLTWQRRHCHGNMKDFLCTHSVFQLVHYLIWRTHKFQEGHQSLMLGEITSSFSCLLFVFFYWPFLFCFSCQKLAHINQNMYMYMYFIFDTSCLYYFSCQHHMLSPASEKLGRIRTFWEETLYLHTKEVSCLCPCMK